LQFVYEGKTDCCLQHNNFPSSWNATKTPTYWSNEHTTKEYFTEIILPFVDEKRRILKLSSEQQALLNFKAQCTLSLLDANNISVVMIPPNCTDRLQPLQLSVNKAAKDFFACMLNKCAVSLMDKM